MPEKRSCFDNPYALASLLGIFFVLRLWGLLQPHLFANDESVYATLGFQLRHYPTHYSGGNIQTLFDEWWVNHALNYLDRPLFKHPPLYPMALALSYAVFGDNVFAAFLPSLLGWTGICLLTRKIARHVFGPPVAFIAFCLCLVDPMGWALSQRIFAESFMTFFLLLGLWLYLKNSPDGSLVSCGIAIGLACLVKYSAYVYLAAILSHLLMLRSYGRARHFFLPCGLILAPWFLALIAAYRWDFLKMIGADFFVSGPFLVAGALTAGLCGMLLPLWTYLDRIRFWDGLWGERIARWVPTLAMASPILWFGTRITHVFLWDSYPLVTILRFPPPVPGFYFFQPLLILPFLIMVPFAPLLIPPMQKRSGFTLLLLLVALTFALAANWHEPWTRYIYSVVPALILLAAATGWQAWKRLGALPLRIGNLSRAGMILLAAYLFAKTLRNDWFYGVAGQMTWF